MKKFVLASFALATTLAIVPAASATTFDWQYGGAGDPVYASGTLIATPDASIAGAFDILSGSGTRVTSAGIFAVSIIGFGDPGPFPRSAGLTGPCTYSPSTGCNITDAGAGGSTADLIFDNLLYASNAPGYQLDGDGFVLFEASAPGNDSDYYSVWGTGSSSQIGPSDQEFDPYTYDGVNLNNPFEVSPASTGVAPEPGSLFLLGTGLLGLGVVLYRKAKPSTGFVVSL